MTELKKRTRLLMLYDHGLKRMRTELATYGMSIPELMQKLSDNEREWTLFPIVCSYIEQNGAMAFESGWKSYFVSHGDYLKDTEYRLIVGLGEILGRYTIDEQLEAIDRVSDALVLGVEETRHKVHEVSRLYLGTSFALSAMLVVMLL